MKSGDIRRRVKEVEEKAHAGGYGAWRKGYCCDYRKLQQEACAEALANLLPRIALTGKAITCHRGCTYCCSDYISIPVAQGVVIVDFLYGSEERLKQFLKAYETWQHRLNLQPASVSVMQRLETITTYSPVVQPTPQALLTEYFDLGIPCPFLTGAGCLIYPVRPICCASHFAVSPPTWCAPGSPNPSLICEATPLTNRLRQLDDLGEPMLSRHQETMPSLIYRLLVEGLPEVMLRLEALVENNGKSHPICW
jgi:Fe-S-cluster containining protein